MEENTKMEIVTESPIDQQGPLDDYNKSQTSSDNNNLGTEPGPASPPVPNRSPLVAASGHSQSFPQHPKQDIEVKMETSVSVPPSTDVSASDSNLTALTDTQPPSEGLQSER
jgi:hypothetical protein